jgi:hypothetical protein
MVGTEDFVVCGLLISRGSGRYGGGFKMGVLFFGHWIASPLRTFLRFRSQ